MNEEIPNPMETQGEESAEQNSSLSEEVLEKMGEEGFAENAMSALEGAKDIGAAAGMMAGMLVSKLYSPGDDDQDIAEAVAAAVDEILSIAQDMGVAIDEQVAKVAADQAGQLVVGMMDQHDAAQEPQEPQGMTNPYEGM